MVVDLRKVFQKFRKVNLKLNPKKCTLLGKQIKYLGHVILAEGISTDLEKLKAVLEWPEQETGSQFSRVLLILSEICEGVFVDSKTIICFDKNNAKFVWSKQGGVLEFETSIDFFSGAFFLIENGRFDLKYCVWA